MAGNQSHYLYTPSPALAAVVAGLFGICFLITLFLIIRKRTWVWLVMLFGIGMEVVGYAARVVSANNVTEKTPYVVQFTLVILAPVLMAGVIYVLFSRIVFWVVPPELRTMRFIWVPPRFITLIFVGFDIISLLLQLIAALLISGTNPTDSNAQQKINLGKDLGLAGVGVQLAGFGLFSIAAARFHFSSRKVDTDFARMNMTKHGIQTNWTTLLWVVNASCVLILIRSVFRMVEFSEGRTGAVQQAEWYTYVFDTLPIFLVVVLYNIWFPGNYLKHLGFRLPKEHRRLPSDPETLPMGNMRPQV
ncbi:RTA1 like protein-domain-containing protein [Mariannaea sp. PMI_226]|nr:RTA1 like protein-domain-containing protein [Mariannaea sp. PMI_226]